MRAWSSGGLVSRIVERLFTLTFCSPYPTTPPILDQTIPHHDKPSSSPYRHFHGLLVVYNDEGENAKPKVILAYPAPTVDAPLASLARAARAFVGACQRQRRRPEEEEVSTEADDGRMRLTACFVIASGWRHEFYLQSGRAHRRQHRAAKSHNHQPTFHTSTRHL